jgi:uncharacterized protein
MKLTVGRLFDIPGERENFEGTVDFGWIELRGEHPFKTPVALKGAAQNRTGVVTLDYTARFRMSVRCDRCLRELDREESLEFTHTLVRELHSEGGDDYLLIPDGVLDMEAVCAADVQLELPAQYLCRPDCKGLCPVCGANQNEGDCGCRRTKTDPRLEILKELL